MIQQPKPSYFLSAPSQNSIFNDSVIERSIFFPFLTHYVNILDEWRTVSAEDVLTWYESVYGEREGYKTGTSIGIFEQIASLFSNGASSIIEYSKHFHTHAILFNFPNVKKRMEKRKTEKRRKEAGIDRMSRFFENAPIDRRGIFGKVSLWVSPRGFFDIDIERTEIDREYYPKIFSRKKTKTHTIFIEDICRIEVAEALYTYLKPMNEDGRLVFVPHIKFREYYRLSVNHKCRETIICSHIEGKIFALPYRIFTIENGSDSVLSSEPKVYEANDELRYFPFISDDVRFLLNIGDEVSSFWQDKEGNRVSIQSDGVMTSNTHYFCKKYKCDKAVSFLLKNGETLLYTQTENEADE